MNGNLKHTQIALEVAGYVFLANYIQSPSVTSYLHAHGWLADLVVSLWSAIRVFQTYAAKEAANPTPPAQPDQLK